MSDQDEDDAHIFRWCEACRESHCVYCAQTDDTDGRDGVCENYKRAKALALQEARDE